MNKLTLAQCLERLKDVHGSRYDYSLFIDYHNNKQKIEVICMAHGVFEQIYANHFKGSGCPKCKADKLGKSFRSSSKEFIAKSRNVHGNKYSYDNVKYALAQNEVDIICPNHGSFFQRPHNHLKGAGCPKCKLDTLRLLFSDSLEDFIKKAKRMHGDVYSYKDTKYCGSDIKVEIICKKHGTFFQTPHNHIAGKGCKKCAMVSSKKESKWLDFCGVPLEDRNIRFKINGRWFNVDGYDSNTKTIYEFYGDFWHGNPKVHKSFDINMANKKTFGELYRKTLEKERFLKNAGFEVVSMWESDSTGQKEIELKKDSDEEKKE